MELYYNEYGDGGPALVILHGLLGSSGNWHTLSRNVFSEVAHVYAVDQRNHGRSPHAEAFNYEVMADDLRGFLDRRGLASAIVLGHSMGGKTAMQAALTYPERVDALLVADMAPKAYPPHHTGILEALQRIDPTAYADRQAIDDALAEDVSSFPIRQFLLKNLHYDGERYTWQMNLEAIAANYDAVTAALPAEGTYDGPVRFIRGARSDYVADEDLAGIKARFPRADLVTIPGADHWVHADNPEAFGEAVVEEIRKVEGETRNE